MIYLVFLYYQKHMHFNRQGCVEFLNKLYDKACCHWKRINNSMTHNYNYDYFKIIIFKIKAHARVLLETSFTNAK